MQHSGIKNIENMQHCSLANLKTLNISFNNIKVIHASNFLCLERIDVLDLSNNDLQFIAEAALDGINLLRLCGLADIYNYVVMLVQLPVVKWVIE